MNSRGSDAHDDDGQRQALREFVAVKRVVYCAEDSAPADDEGFKSVHLLRAGRQTHGNENLAQNITQDHITRKVCPVRRNSGKN